MRRHNQPFTAIAENPCYVSVASWSFFDQSQILEAVRSGQMKTHPPLRRPMTEAADASPDPELACLKYEALIANVMAVCIPILSPHHIVSIAGTEARHPSVASPHTLIPTRALM